MSFFSVEIFEFFSQRKKKLPQIYVENAADFQIQKGIGHVFYLFSLLILLKLIKMFLAYIASII